MIHYIHNLVQMERINSIMQELYLPNYSLNLILYRIQFATFYFWGNFLIYNLYLFAFFNVLTSTINFWAFNSLGKILKRKLQSSSLLKKYIYTEDLIDCGVYFPYCMNDFQEAFANWKMKQKNKCRIANSTVFTIIFHFMQGIS